MRIQTQVNWHNDRGNFNKIDKETSNKDDQHDQHEKGGRLKLGFHNNAADNFLAVNLLKNIGEKLCPNQNHKHHTTQVRRVRHHSLEDLVS